MTMLISGPRVRIDVSLLTSFGGFLQIHMAVQPSLFVLLPKCTTWSNDELCQRGYAMAVVSYDDETQIVVPVQGFLPQVFTFSSPPFVESSQLGRAPPIDGPIDPWVGHVDLAPHRLPTSEPRV